MSDLREIMEQVIAFRDARDWRQFHSPKNLAMAMASEVGEVCDLFRWMTEDMSRAPHETRRAEAGREIADVMIFALAFCDALGLDPEEQIQWKLREGERRYPVALAKGNATKYTELGR